MTNRKVLSASFVEAKANGDVFRFERCLVRGQDGVLCAEECEVLSNEGYGEASPFASIVIGGDSGERFTFSHCALTVFGATCACIGAKDDGVDSAG